MDSGWAVVIGAMVAFAGSALVPWVREGFTQRSQRRLRRREELAEAIRRVLDVAARQIDNPHDSIVELESAAAQFGLVIDERDGEHIGGMVDRLVAQLILGAEDRLAWKTYSLVSTILPKWYRGGMTSREARAKFDLGIREHLEKEAFLRSRTTGSSADD